MRARSSRDIEQYLSFLRVIGNTLYTARLGEHRPLKMHSCSRVNADYPAATRAIVQMLKFAERTARARASRRETRGHRCTLTNQRSIDRSIHRSEPIGRFVMPIDLWRPDIVTRVVVFCHAARGAPQSFLSAPIVRDLNVGLSIAGSHTALGILARPRRPSIREISLAPFSTPLRL